MELPSHPEEGQEAVALCEDVIVCSIFKPCLKSWCPAAKWNVSTIKAVNKPAMNLCPQRQICRSSIFMVPENQRCVDKLEVI